MCRSYLESKSRKLSTRNNLLQNLVGASWGACADTLTTAALGLVYPTAEYACPMWINSTLVSKIDVQLNRTMRIVLPALSNIYPPRIRREEPLLRTIEKSENEPLLLHDLLEDVPRQRLQRTLPYEIAKALKGNQSDANV